MSDLTALIQRARERLLHANNIDLSTFLNTDGRDLLRELIAALESERARADAAEARQGQLALMASQSWDASERAGVADEAEFWRARAERLEAAIRQLIDLLDDGKYDAAYHAAHDALDAAALTEGDE